MNINLGGIMSKEQHFKNEQSSYKSLSNKDFSIEKFTPEELEEIDYYLEVISPIKLGGKILNFDENDSN
ncbi:MAG: hypothetical protein RCO49_03960 [Rickettsia endosymbiont of Argas persicus]